MNRICREMQDRLALEGAAAVRDDEAAQRHVEGCDVCFEALERLGRLDEALGAMAGSASDAPQPVVERLFERIATEGAAGPAADEPSAGTRGRLAMFRHWPQGRRPALWAMTSAAAVATVAFLVSVPLRSERPQAASERRLMEMLPPAGTRVGEEQRGERLKPARAPVTASYEKSAVEQRKEEPTLRDTKATTRTDSPDFPMGVTVNPGPSGPVAYEREKLEESDAYRAVQATESKKRQNELQKTDRDAPAEGVVDGISEAVGGGVPGGVAGGVVGGVGEKAGKASAQRVGGAIREPKLIHRVEPVYPAEARAQRVEGIAVLELIVGPNGRVTAVKVLRAHPLLAPAAEQAVRQWVYAPTLVGGRPSAVTLTVTVAFSLGEKPASSLAPADPARAFLEERAQIEGVLFQEATGYWRNTYVPGEARMRLLQARLASWDHAALAAPPHDQAAPPAQPFDVTRGAALAVYVQADRAALEGPQRMLVQVGLKAAPRVGGARPAMNVGVVLDLRGEVSPDVAAAMRALAAAFAEARQAGDRFHLVVAGRPGGVVVGPDAFKHGPVTVALDQALAGHGAGEGLDLAAAVAAAYESVCAGGDAEAPFGSNAVVVVTGQALGAARGALTDFAHQGAVAGIPLTAVGIGAGAAPSELDALALAGQGRRRVLDARADAPRLVDEELFAASNAVARAVRLRIRLAPGVRLVGVLGSQRLDEIQTQRVRDAERSLDLRLARHMGIEADRGEDEDGIQMVIPAFQAGDAHAIVLDVVAPGPGAVADVSVRYKDVAFLRNGVARAALTLPAGRRAAGALERNVVKNLLAHRLASSLEAAGDAAADGDVAAAHAAVEQARSLLAAVRVRWPGFDADRDLARDTAMLDGYARLLGRSALAPEQRALVADSLRYAGRLKLLRRHA